MCHCCIVCQVCKEKVIGMKEDVSFNLAEIKEEKKNNFNFEENKFAFYSALFYALGLFLGSYFYKLAQSDKLNTLAVIKDNDFKILLLSDFCLYFSIFLIAAFLGFCLISKPIIYSIPVFIGIATGTRIAYYFVNYSTKGVGYSLIMIIPYIALFITVISFTINTSNELSSKLINLTKGEGEKKFELTPYLKKYLLYFAVIIAVSLLDSGLTKVLFSVVTI